MAPLHPGGFEDKEVLARFDAIDDWVEPRKLGKVAAAGLLEKGIIGGVYANLEARYAVRNRKRKTATRSGAARVSIASSWLTQAVAKS